MVFTLLELNAEKVKRNASKTETRIMYRILFTIIETDFGTKLGNHHVI